MTRARAIRSHFVIAAERDRRELRARLRRRPGFRLLWGQTWTADRRDDFVGCLVSAEAIVENAGRIYLETTTTGRVGQWLWTASIGPFQISSGWESDARKAALAVEAAFWPRRQAAVKDQIRARLGRSARLPLP